MVTHGGRTVSHEGGSIAELYFKHECMNSIVVTSSGVFFFLTPDKGRHYFSVVKKKLLGKLTHRQLCLDLSVNCGRGEHPQIITAESCTGLRNIFLFIVH